MIPAEEDGMFGTPELELAVEELDGSVAMTGSALSFCESSMIYRCYKGQRC